MNALLSAGDQCLQGSDWKESVQNYEANAMLYCYGIKRKLLEKTYRPEKGKSFLLNERGRTRYTKAPTVQDRIVGKAVNQVVLLPEILPKLIYDNGASVKGKGNDFGRRRFETQIHRHFRERGDNGGYVLFGDFSKYFDNLRHDKLKAMFRRVVPNDEEFELLCLMIDAFRPDVSYMSDEEYEGAMGAIFNSLDHIGESGDGSKLLEKGCDIGAELSQTAGVFYPHEMDNYFKIVKGVKYFGRFMDDTSIIGDTMEEMLTYRKWLKEQSEKLGIFLNEKKTRICRLDKPFTWLKIKYRLTETGHLIRCLDHDAIVRERKRIKYLAWAYHEGMVTRKYCEHCYLCWRGGKIKYDSHRSIESLDALYRELIGPIDTFKKR